MARDDNAGRLSVNYPWSNSALSEEIIGYFGYGSLVNAATLRTSYVSLKKARLKGWRRHWQSRGIETVAQPAGTGTRATQINLALLSIHHHAETTIDGMLVLDRAEHLEKVDEREARYERVELPVECLEVPEKGSGEALPERLYVYVAQEQQAPAHTEHLLQSYLDAVMAGFHSAHGPEGVDRFIATTIGFDRPIHCDRSAPLYPRAVEIAPEMASLLDVRLKACAVQFP